MHLCILYECYRGSDDHYGCHGQPRCTLLLDWGNWSRGLEVVCVQHVNKHHNSYLFEEQQSPKPGVGIDKTITEEILTSSSWRLLSLAWLWRNSVLNPFVRSIYTHTHKLLEFLADQSLQLNCTLPPVVLLVVLYKFCRYFESQVLLQLLIASVALKGCFLVVVFFFWKRSLCASVVTTTAHMHTHRYL